MRAQVSDVVLDLLPIPGHRQRRVGSLAAVRLPVDPEPAVLVERDPDGVRAPGCNRCGVGIVEVPVVVAEAVDAPILRARAVDAQQADRLASAIDKVVARDRDRQGRLRRPTRRAAEQGDDERERDPREPRRNPSQLSTNPPCQCVAPFSSRCYGEPPTAVHSSVNPNASTPRQGDTPHRSRFRSTTGPPPTVSARHSHDRFPFWRCIRTNELFGDDARHRRAASRDCSATEPVARKGMVAVPCDDCSTR